MSLQQLDRTRLELPAHAQGISVEETAERLMHYALQRMSDGAYESRKGRIWRTL